MQLNEFRYEKQMISIDVSIFSIFENELHVLLIKRNKEPFIGCWSLAGGGVYNDETCETAVIREMKEKLGTQNLSPILAGVFSEPNRDIRFRNISVSYFALVSKQEFDFQQTSEKVKEIKWEKISSIPPLAFDHNLILEKSIGLLKEKIWDISFIKPYLPTSFTLGSLQAIFESVLGTKLDKRNFRRKISSLNCLEKTGGKNENDPHKKSDIYKFI